MCWRVEGIGMLRLSPRNAWIGAQSNHPCAVRLGRCLLLAVGASFWSLMLLAQTSDSRTTTGSNDSWMATTDLKSKDANPTRTVETFDQNGNRTIDNRAVQLRGSDGQFQPYQDIETERMQVDGSTLRTITRAFGRDSNGAKKLVQITEEEKHTLPSGDSNVVRITSSPDTNGRLQPVRRELVEARNNGMGVEETNTTVMLSSINGGLAPVLKTQEIRKRGANDTIETRKTTLLPDGAGKWQVNEVVQATARQEGSNRTIEERISRRDFEGKLSEISRTVSKESETASGENRKTVETYSVDVPGMPRDGKLHLVERATTNQRSSSTGEQITQQQVEQLNPGDPAAGLRLSISNTETVRSGDSGEQTTRTIQAGDANGTLGIVSVETTNSKKAPSRPVQQTPDATPR